MIIPVILSGGSGTRLWPLSRMQRPKQFIPISGDLTFFQQTVLRLKDLEEVQAPLVVCNEAHRFLVAEDFRSLGSNHQGVLLEPVPKNTAPAITLAALMALTLEDDPVLFVLPSDHLIDNTIALGNALKVARKVAAKGNLVTFGIVPDKPETGYGYIQQGSPIDKTDGYNVSCFIEKPTQKNAEKYLSDGGYLWNSGMFVFHAKQFLEEIGKHAPDVLKWCKVALDEKYYDMDFIRIDADAFLKNPKISVDYAVMEKTKKIAVVPLDVGWKDMGSWSAVWEAGEQDDSENVTHGDVIMHDATRNYVHTDQALVSLVGVSHLAVVASKDAILVADMKSAQEIKQVVEQLKSQDAPEVILHREVIRPWGSYECVEKGHRYQVKRIVVNPGATLSLQKHHHRAEHWIVVKGTAEVTRDDDTFILSENESTYIPLGAVHRLSNPGKLPVELIEIQTGSYLEEDDIVRLEDIYGRNVNVDTND